MKATLRLMLLVALGYLVGALVEARAPWLLPYLVLYNKAVLSGYYYELLTAVLITPSFLDFFLNAISLYAVYLLFGSEAGSAEYAVFFLSGALGNALTVLLYPPETLSAGASGGIFGLISFYVTRNMARTRDVGWAGPALLVVLFLLSSMFPRVNYVAHLGGIIGGVLAGLVEPRINRV